VTAESLHALVLAAVIGLNMFYLLPSTISISFHHSPPSLAIKGRDGLSLRTRDRDRDRRSDGRVPIGIFCLICLLDVARSGSAERKSVAVFVCSLLVFVLFWG